MVTMSCVTLAMVLLGCLLGLLIIRWQRSSSSRCGADDESKTDEAEESRRIVSRDVEAGDGGGSSSGGWLRRVFCRATGSGGASSRHDRSRHHR